MSEILSSGLTVTIPSSGDSNWATSIKTNCFQKISEHDHTGSGKGIQIATGAIASLAVTAAKLAADSVTTAKILDANVTLAKLATDAVGSFVPAGALLPYGGTAAPTGYLLCDGTAVSRATYAALYAVLADAYGAGNGTTTFNLPDLRGKFPLGKATAGTGSTLGGTGGAIDLSHTHSTPAHYHAMGTGADLNITSSGSGTSGTESADHTHTFSDTSSGQSNDHTHNPAQGTGDFLYINGGGGTSASLVGASAGTTYQNQTGGTSNDHTHDVSGTTSGKSATHTHSTPAHTHAAGAVAGKIGLVTGGVDGNAAMTSGANSALNPPFQAVNYIIKT